MINKAAPFHIIKLFWCLLLCLGGGWISGLVTEQSLESWYPFLNKPSWTPPHVVFPVAWTILYILMAVSLWLVWKSNSTNKQLAYIVFFIQLFLNFIWSWLFFYLKNPVLGLLDILLLICAIAFTMICFWKHSKIATYLLIPYLLWVCYAFSLNWYIWMNN